MKTIKINTIDKPHLLAATRYIRFTQAGNVEAEVIHGIGKYYLLSYWPSFSILFCLNVLIPNVIVT